MRARADFILEGDYCTVTEIGALTHPMDKSPPILSPGISKVEEQALSVGPISESARKGKERTEKQNTGSVTFPEKSLWD